MKKRRSLLVVLPALFAMTLAGCGGDKGGNEGGGNQEQQETRKDVTGVTLNKTTAKVAPGKTLALTATVAPGDATDKSVIWSSDDETVATVNENGVVTAVAEGTANIKVKTNDGNFEDTCVVTVGYTPKITINNTNGTTPTYPTILVGAEYQINAVVTEANGEQGLTDLGLIFSKSSTNENISLSETGLVTGLKKGSCEVTVKSHYDENVSVKVTFNVVQEQPALPEKASNDFNLRKTGQLVDGATVMFASTLDDNYYFMGDLAGNIHTPIQTTIESEKLVVPEGAAAFTVVDNGDETYSFKDENNNYLASGNGKNNYLVRNAEVTPEAKWEITFGDKGYVDMLSKTETLDGDGVAHNVATLNPNTGNSGGPRFACYKPTSAAGYSKLAIFEADKALGLSIEQAPTKVKYLEGDEFDAAGAQFKVQHSWNEEEVIGSDATGLTYDKTEPLTLTDNSVTFSYKGVSVNQPIEVVEKVLSSIAVDATNLVKTTYSKNGTVDATGLVVTATYNAGTDLEREETLELGTGYVLVDTTVGDQPSDSKQITIKAVEDETKTATFTVEVLDKQVVSVTLSGTLTKDDYFTGESLDPTGLSAHIAYDDTTEEDRPLPDAEVTITPAGALTATDVDVKATFGGVDSNTLEGAYSVHDAVLDNIQIDTTGVGKYMVGEKLNKEEIVVTAYTDQYPTSNGSVVTDFIVKSGEVDVVTSGFATAGEQTLTVSYTAGGITKTATFSINVAAFSSLRRPNELAQTITNKDGKTYLGVDGTTTGEKFTMEGVIIAKPGNNLIIQDGDFGMIVYKNGQSTGAMEIGKRVRFESKVTNYGGAPESEQLANTAITILEDAVNLPTAAEIDSKEDFDNLNMCLYSNYSNLVVTKVPTKEFKVNDSDNSFYAKFAGDSTNKEFQVFFKKAFINADMCTAANNLEVGSTIALDKAYKSSYSGNAQICPSAASTLTDSTVYLPKSITLNATSATIEVDEEFDLVATVAPAKAADKTITWSSSDAESVTVDSNGKIKGIKVTEEDVTITAKCNADNSVVASCAVKVIAPRTFSSLSTTGGFKTAYTTNDSDFAIDNLKVFANYTNGDTEEVTNYTVTWSDEFDNTVGSHSSTPTIHWDGHDLPLSAVSYTVTQAAADTTIALPTTGTNVSGGHIVKIGSDTTELPAIKLGTASKAGSAIIKVPAGTKKLQITGAGWNGKTCKLTVSYGTFNKQIDIASDTGASSNSPFTITGNGTYEYICEFDSALEAETDVTLSTTVCMVVWSIKALGA